MSSLGLNAIDVIAEQHAWLNAADALVLFQTAKSCLSVAKRGAIRRPGGVLVAPNLLGVSEARRRKLGSTGLRALARLLEGVKIQACALAHVTNKNCRPCFDDLAGVLGSCSTLALQACVSMTLVRSTTLRELRISHGNLSTDTLSALVTACPPLLEGLSLAGCSVLTKDPFLAVLGGAPYAPNLRRLDLAGMKKLTSDGINGSGSGDDGLRDRLPRLEMLGLDGCDNVDIGSILILLDSVPPFPALRSLHAARAAPSTLPYPGPFGEAIAAAIATCGVTWMALTDNGTWWTRRKNPIFEGALERHGADAAAACLTCFTHPGQVIDAVSANSRDRAARAVTALRRLNTRGRIALSAAIFLVWRAAPNLVALDVSNSDDDVAGRLAKLCGRLPALRSLAVACLEPPLEDAGLEAALAALPNPTRMRLLDVSGNASLTSVGVADATRRCGPRFVVVARGVDGVRRRPRPRCGCGDSCCSFERTGARMVKQDAFGCATCSLAGQGDAICGHCVATCHEGHSTFYLGHFKMFCDCPRMCGDCDK